MAKKTKEIVQPGAPASGSSPAGSSQSQTVPTSTQASSGGASQTPGAPAQGGSSTSGNGSLAPVPVSQPPVAVSPGSASAEPGVAGEKEKKKRGDTPHLRAWRAACDKVNGKPGVIRKLIAKGKKDETPNAKYADVRKHYNELLAQMKPSEVVANM